MKLFMLTVVILLAALSRLIPHPANFTPIAAMALASGAFFGRKSIGVLVPVVALLVSDFVIGGYPGMIFTYLGMALIFVLGANFCQTLQPLRIFGATVSGSVIFFVVSNFGVWIASGMYPQTLSGLASCYANAIPFFGNTLLGDLTYSTAIFLAVYGITLNKPARAS